MEPERREVIARIKREVEPLTFMNCKGVDCEECPAINESSGGCLFIDIYDKAEAMLK